MSAMMNSSLFCVQYTRPPLRLAGVQRNDVPTIIAFRTLAEAQRARTILWNQTWAYDAWGEVLIMMPLKKAVRADEGSLGIFRTSPHAIHRRGMNKFGVDVCEVDVDDTLRVSRAMFVHKEVDVCLVNNQLQRAWAL
jgi:hypothetical protein